MTLDELIAVYRSRLHLPDPGVVEVVLAAWVANLLADDAPWLLVVGPPASGKTEVVSSLRDLPHAHVASDLSEAGLLTYGRKEDDTGDPSTAGRGLLRDIGQFGIILAPELSTLIAEGKREGSKVFGALREISTDHRYSRQGKDGRKLLWDGKAGFIGCVTEAVDELGMGALGERFLLYRMPLATEEDDLLAGKLALSDDRNAIESVREATIEFISSLDVPATIPVLSDGDRDRLTLVASFVSRVRSTVIWDSRHDSIVDVPQPERSPRLLRGCADLLRGLQVIGCMDTEAWRVVRHMALGSIRTRKRRVLAALLGSDVPMTISSIAAEARLPETGVRRDLAEMDAFGIAQKVTEGSPFWDVSDMYRHRWTELTKLGGEVGLDTLTSHSSIRTGGG